MEAFDIPEAGGDTQARQVGGRAPGRGGAGAVHRAVTDSAA